MSLLTNTSLNFRLPVTATADSVRQQVAEFLQREGYQAVRAEAEEVSARRGTLLGWMIGGDPRRIPHTVRIANGAVAYKIGSRFLWFTEADKDVFRTEARNLAAMLENRESEGPSMAEVQKFRLKTDIWYTVVMVIVLITVMAGSLLCMKYLNNQVKSSGKPTSMSYGPAGAIKAKSVPSKR